MNNSKENKRFNDYWANATKVKISGLHKLDNTPVRVVGRVQECQTHQSRNSQKMAFIVLKDLTGTIEVIVFPDAFAQYKHLLIIDQSIEVTGTAMTDEHGTKIITEFIRKAP